MSADPDRSPIADPPLRRPRLTSLDAFRGLTIAAMILVNNPGSWGDLYPPLAHAEWDGWTPTDLIFPSFVFILGVAIPLALGARRDRGARWWSLAGKVLVRTAILFGLGLLLNGFPNYDLATLRIPGVLQRIALCYAAAAFLYLMFGPRPVLGIAAVLLVGYAAAMLLVPVPGYGAGDLSRAGNLAAYLDRLAMPGHLYKADYDPEGLLSTLPAIATALLGVRAGRWIREGRPNSEVCALLMVSGFAYALFGQLWAVFVPINKALWSAPFVLWTAGLGSLLFGSMFWIIDVQGRKRWAWPLVVFGVNPISAFVLSGLLARGLGLIHLPASGGRQGPSLKEAAYDALLRTGLEPINASLAFAACYVLLWFGVMALFYRKGIIIRV